MSNLDTRFRKSKATGSHKDQGREGGANASKSTGSHMDQGREGGATKTSSRGSQNHLDPVFKDVDGPQTPHRGGDNRVGHDRVNPTAGKSKSGNHLDQHPNNRRRK